MAADEAPPRRQDRQENNNQQGNASYNTSSSYTHFPFTFFILAVLASWRLIHSNSLTLGTIHITPMANNVIIKPPAASAHCAP